MNVIHITEESVENLKAFQCTIFSTRVKDTDLYKALKEYLVGQTAKHLKILSLEIEVFENTQVMGDTLLSWYYKIGEMLDDECWYDSYNYEIANAAIHQLNDEYSR